MQVSFCHNHVKIRCDDAELAQRLRRYFQYCLLEPTQRVDSSTLIASYALKRNEAGQLQLWYKEKLQHPQPSTLYSFTYLTQSVTASLIRACQSGLALHAAGLSVAGQGLILCGKSGSGKSTLTTWLTASGYGLLSDEIVSVNPASLTMTGLTRPIVLKDGSAFVWEHWLDEAAQTELTYFFNNSVWLHPDTLRPGCVQREAQAKWLIFPTYQADSPLRAEKLTAAQASFRLMHQLVNFESLPDQGFRQANRITPKLTAYSLTYPDVEAASAWITQTLQTSQAEE
jgi:hypothetical protein